VETWALIAVIGLVLGAAIFIAVPGKIRGGILLTMLVGALAALVSAWIGAQLGIASQGTAIGFFIAVIGTGLILAVWRMTMGRV
jgi:uncharacterized membrane protein YeaQ/YmgE (transglycosylase-associated protein family)